MTVLSALPFLGSGLGYRAELSAGIREHADRIDWLEIITEHFLFTPADQRERLRELREHFPIVPHGVELSIGSREEIDAEYLAALAELVAEIEAPWFSDHLCFTRAGGVALGLLAPLPRTREVARKLGRRAQRVQETVGVPFLLENITYYVNLRTPLSEAQFIAELLEHCECGLLLDLANLDINARNHGFDAPEFLDAIPVERVIQVHLAGGVDGVDGHLSRDSHGEPVPPRVWELLEDLVSRTPLRASLVERDQNFPDDVTELVGEVERARQVLSGTASVPPRGA